MKINKDQANKLMIALVDAMEDGNMDFIKSWQESFGTPDYFFDDLIPLVQWRKEIGNQLQLISESISYLESGDKNEETLAWHKYIIYCMEQMDKYDFGSRNYRYYQNEIKKCQLELARLCPTIAES